MLDSEFERLGINPARVTAGAPAGAENAVFDLKLTHVDTDGPGGNQPTGITLTWTEQLIGDYNQDGLVNVSDLTPVGQYWDQGISYDATTGVPWWPAGDPGGGGAFNWRLARVDGNHDGLIYLSDITTIAQHWLEQLGGYHVERSMHFDGQPVNWELLEFGPSYAKDPLIQRSSFSFTGTTGAAGGVLRYSVEIPLDNPLIDQSFRVSPVDTATGHTGTQSPAVAYQATVGADTQPPTWTGTTGVAAVLPVTGGLEVRFGTAVDLQSPPVSYRVYWEQFDPEAPATDFPFESALYIDTDSSPALLGILTEGHYYRVAVRARDSAAPHNWELNEATLYSFYGSGDIYPPQWESEAGIQGLQFGDGRAIVTWGRAEDSFNDGEVVWANGPVIYRVYHGPGTEPVIGGADYAEFTDAGAEAHAVELTGIDTSEPHWFVVRARDQAQYPNEDPNGYFIVGEPCAVATTDLPGPGPGVPAGYSQVRTVRVVSSPDHAYNKLVVIWRRPGLEADSWLSSWLITPEGLSHDLDLFLPHDHVQFTPRAWILDDNGNHELLYIFSTIYEIGDRVRHYRQATDTVEEYILDMQYAVLAGFDLDYNPWIIGYIDNGFIVPYPFFEMYFSYLPVTDPQVFYTSTPDDPHYSYDFFCPIHYLDGTIEAAGRENGAAGSNLLLRHTTVGTVVTDGYGLPTAADTLQQVFGRGIESPVLSYSGPDGDGRFIGFSQGSVRRHFRAPHLFTADDVNYRIRAADSISEVIFVAELTTGFWHGTETPDTHNTVNIWDGDREITVPVPGSVAGPAKVAAVAVLGNGSYCWAWQSDPAGAWQFSRGSAGTD